MAHRRAPLPPLPNMDPPLESTVCDASGWGWAWDGLGALCVFKAERNQRTPPPPVLWWTQPKHVRAHRGSE